MRVLLLGPPPRRSPTRIDSRELQAPRHLEERDLADLGDKVPAVLPPGWDGEVPGLPLRAFSGGLGGLRTPQQPISSYVLCRLGCLIVSWSAGRTTAMRPCRSSKMRMRCAHSPAERSSCSSGYLSHDTSRRPLARCAPALRTSHRDTPRSPATYRRQHSRRCPRSSRSRPL